MAGATDYTVREIILSRIPATAGGGRPLVSADNRQVAFIVLRRGQWCMSLNGVEGPLYRKVYEWTFSPDGKRLAYSAKKELSRQVVVLDGKESAEYEYQPGSLTFSPDSRQFAFNTANSKAFFAVWGDKQGPDLETLCCAAGAPSLFFSPDGQKLAYTGKRVSAAGATNSEVVVEGDHREIVARADNALIYGFSADGRHLAWGVQRSNQWQILVDGKPDPWFDRIGANSFRFSSNSLHWAYFAEQGGRYMAVLDGKPGPRFESMGDYAPVLSPDGKRWAYVGVRDGKRLVVIDGRESATYDGVHAGLLQFSPDGQHVAFGAARGLRQFVVRDGKEEEVGDKLKWMLFSPDSHHLAYAAISNGRARFVVDDKSGEAYDDTAERWACFSPDSQHLAYGAIRDGKLVVVVDNHEVGVYEGNLGTLAFEGPNLVSGVVTRLNEKFDLEVLRLEIQISPQ
jgi:Tol biopolymer transport system component